MVLNIDMWARPALPFFLPFLFRALFRGVVGCGVVDTDYFEEMVYGV